MASDIISFLKIDLHCIDRPSVSFPYESFVIFYCRFSPVTCHKISENPDGVKKMYTTDVDKKHN